MKKVYYKICSNIDNKLELLGRYDKQDDIYVYSYESEGTKFSVTRLDDVKILANGYGGVIFEVREEWIQIK